MQTRVRYRRKIWFTEPVDDDIANRRNDTSTVAFTQKVPADHPDYKTRVAEPTMAAIDGMPPEWRALVRRFDYIDVYRAWKRRWPTSRVEEMAGGWAEVCALIGPAARELQHPRKRKSEYT